MMAKDLWSSRKWYVHDADISVLKLGIFQPTNRSLPQPVQPSRLEDYSGLNGIFQHPYYAISQ